MARFHLGIVCCLLFCSLSGLVSSAETPPPAFGFETQALQLPLVSPFNTLHPVMSWVVSRWLGSRPITPPGRPYGFSIVGESQRFIAGGRGDHFVLRQFETRLNAHVAFIAQPLGPDYAPEKILRIFSRERHAWLSFNELLKMMGLEVTATVRERLSGQLIRIMRKHENPIRQQPNFASQHKEFHYNPKESDIQDLQKYKKRVETILEALPQPVGPFAIRKFDFWQGVKALPQIPWALSDFEYYEYAGESAVEQRIDILIRTTAQALNVPLGPIRIAFKLLSQPRAAHQPSSAHPAINHLDRSAAIFHLPARILADGFTNYSHSLKALGASA